jgi:predicted N-formylglutamate amidohydrolase
MRFGAVIEAAGSASPLVLVCEHASNHVPAQFGDLGLTPEAAVAHVAWDIGALGLARALSARLGATLVHAPVSRLVYDLNRPPHSPGAMPERSEVHTIPGNLGLGTAVRAARVGAVYLPFHKDLHALLAGRLAAGQVPVLVTVHSFTPVWHGQPRAVEFGVIHDADARYARAVLAGVSGLNAALNEPYSAADGVTHLLRLHATPYGLPHAMLEIRNDLIANDAAQTAMADRLAPALATATGGL